jgi:hypothetical protein
MANVVFAFFVGVLSALAAAAFGYGRIQKKLYDKEREKKVNDLMESAHELAQKKIAESSVDTILAESNKRYGSASEEDPKK